MGLGQRAGSQQLLTGRGGERLQTGAGEPAQVVGNGHRPAGVRAPVPRDGARDLERPVGVAARGARDAREQRPRKVVAEDRRRQLVERGEAQGPEHAAARLLGGGAEESVW